MTLPLFDYAEAVRRRDRGRNRAARKKETELDTARDIARYLARHRGAITADDVQAELIARDIRLENAAGSIFLNGEFEWTGTYERSKRKDSHCNLLKVWRLK